MSTKVHNVSQVFTCTPTKASGLQAHKGLVLESVGIYLIPLLLSPQPSPIAYNSTQLKPGMTVSNGENL